MVNASPHASVLRPIEAEQFSETIEMLARAFETDPLFRFLLPEPGTRMAWLRFIMGAMVAMNRPHGLLFTLEHPGAIQAAVAVHVPGAYKEIYRHLVRYLLEPTTWRAGRPSLPFLVRAVRLLATIDRLHPKDPHYYVQCLGVDPDRQGKGLGGRLLDSVLTMARRDRMPTYLETSNPDNLIFYRRFGFEVLSEVALSGDYPPVWTMLRSASA